MNIEMVVVALLVVAFYGGIAFLIWKNRKQRAASTRTSELEFREMAYKSESEEPSASRKKVKRSA